MTRCFAICMMLAIFGSTPSAQLRIRITAPTTKAKVAERPIVEGAVSDPKASVWIIVHPLEVSDYWVQPRVTVHEDGVWKAQIFIGRPGRVDVNKIFEIRAVANPKIALREGLMLDHWPEADATSDVTELTRK